MLTDSKSTLARLMATENLFIEQKHVNTASFDLVNRVLTVPYLDGNISPELYDLLLGHEVGHALETPMEGWHESIVDHGVEKSILNVCEDARIEKKIKRKFPGIRISFLKGYEELLQSDFFSISGKNVNEFNLIDRINLHTKCGVHLPIVFSAEESALVKEVENTETFEQVVEVAKKIQSYMSEDLKNRKEREVKKLVIKVDGKSEEGNIDGTAIEAADIKPEDYDEVEIEFDESAQKLEQEVTAAGKDGYIDSETDNSFRKKESTLYRKQRGQEFVYYNIPKLNLEDIIIDYKTLYSNIMSHNTKGFSVTSKKVYSNFKNESSRVVSYLVKEFELRKNAQQMQRAKVSKTGMLNMSELHNYKLTDDLFKKITVVPNGKSHGLVMFIDWSGSMHEYINSTIKQLLNLCLFCKKVSIPFEVYAFHSSSKILFDKGYENIFALKPADVQASKPNDLFVIPFSLMNLLSSKMSTHEFNNAATYLVNFNGRSSSQDLHYPEYMMLSGTPLNECIIASFDIIEKFKNNTKMEVVNAIFLTDGEGTMLTEKYTNNTGKRQKYLSNGLYQCIVRDTITKEQHTFDCARTQKNALLKLLKKRENINIVGFHICDNREFRQVLFSLNQEHYAVENNLEKFKRDGHFILDDDGYDEYYALKSNRLEMNDGEFSPTSDTTRGLVSAFSKYNGGKINSRIVLNRFIGVIA